MAKGDPLVRQQSAREMEELYRQYRAPMFRVAMSILRDEGLAEDAVQQAFLKIFQNFEKIRLEEPGTPSSTFTAGGGGKTSSPLRTWSSPFPPGKAFPKNRCCPGWTGKRWRNFWGSWRNGTGIC